MEYWRGVIIACTSCPAQYSVPDAKVQGKKVRVTCKHCGTGIIVDGTGMGSAAEPAPLSLPEPIPSAARVVPKLEVPKALGSDDDATRVMRRPLDDYSVHEEPTVIGQIPREALEAERRFALRTEPPRAGPSEPPPEGHPILTPVVPPSPAALSTGEFLEPPRWPPAVSAATAFDAMSAPLRAESETTVSTRMPQFRPRRWPWMLGAVIVLSLVALATQVLR